VGLWLPQIVRELFRASDLTTGFLVVIPQVVGSAALSLFTAAPMAIYGPFWALLRGDN
jgi:hypothetical protein